jgi:hypothetical protein
VTIYVPAPEALVATNDTFTGSFNTPFVPGASARIVLNDNSTNADPQLEVVAAGPPSAGTLSEWHPNGSFVWTPDTDWWGTAEFPYTVTDVGTGLNTTAYVSITVAEPGALVAADDYYVGAYNTPRTIGAGEAILLNDGPSPTNATLFIVNVVAGVPASDGVVSALNNATGTFVFTPVRGFTGNTTFRYGEHPAASGCWRRPVLRLGCQFWEHLPAC